MPTLDERIEAARKRMPVPQRFTVCDDCGRNDLPADEAVWADDGASYCKTCRTLTEPAP